LKVHDQLLKIKPDFVIALINTANVKSLLHGEEEAK
jgi:hypothetical protein